MTTPQTPQSLEIEIDAQLAAAAAKVGEIARVQAAIDQMAVELAECDVRILAADEQAAKLELQARLDGTKAPKPSAEGDALHGAKRRLLAASEAAKTMQSALAAERMELLNTAGLLAKNIAKIEFDEQGKRLAALWAEYETAFSDYSAAAQTFGAHAGWNSDAAFSPFDGSKYEPIHGRRCRVLDYDGAALVAALSRSHAARVAERIAALVTE